MIRFYSKKSFTLLEVMIFTSILSIVLVSTAAFVTRLVYNLRINEHKIYANFYVNELQEWLASEKEAGWSGITAKASAGGTVYCMNTVLAYNYTIASLPAAGQCTAFTGLYPTIFKRELILELSNPNTVKATITVNWNEGPKLYTEQIKSVYTSY